MITMTQRLNRVKSKFIPLGSVRRTPKTAAPKTSPDAIPLRTIKVPNFSLLRAAKLRIRPAKNDTEAS